MAAQSRAAGTGPSHRTVARPAVPEQHHSVRALEELRPGPHAIILPEAPRSALVRTVGPPSTTHPPGSHRASSQLLRPLGKPFAGRFPAGKRLLVVGGAVNFMSPPPPPPVRFAWRITNGIYRGTHENDFSARGQARPRCAMSVRPPTPATNSTYT